jgi:acetoin utilization protein AcuB
MNELTVHEFMTKEPRTIGAEQTLEKARRMMNDYRIRHLPVLKAGELVGVLSDRDIEIVESFKDVDATQVTIEEAYTPEPYSVPPQTPLTEVCREMMERKYGSALVVDEKNRLVGIFTWIDALRALIEILPNR